MSEPTPVTRRTFLGSAAIAGAAWVDPRHSRVDAAAQASAPVVTRTDVDLRARGGLGAAGQPRLSRRAGAARGHHLGARRALARRQSHRREQHQGDAMGGVRLLRHVDRLPSGGRLAGARAVRRPSLRHPVGPRPRRRLRCRPRARLPDRAVGRRPHGVAGGHAGRRAVSESGWLGPRAERRARGGQRRGRLRRQHAVVGQPVDAGRRATSKTRAAWRRR